MACSIDCVFMRGLFSPLPTGWKTVMKVGEILVGCRIGSFVIGCSSEVLAWLVVAVTEGTTFPLIDTCVALQELSL